MPVSRRESWTVLGDDDAPVEPIERYLAYLTDIERSPNTVKAYAHDLKDWFTFLAGRGLDWRRGAAGGRRRVRRLAATAAGRPRRAGRGAAVGGSTLRRVDGEPEAVGGRAFYQHAARHGVDVGELLTTWQPAGRGAAWKPFLHHISKAHAAAAAGDLAEGAEEAAADADRRARCRRSWTPCDRLRDRFLFALLYDTGMRIGEALGLRHEDIAAAERESRSCRAINDNGARAKSRTAADDSGQRRS